MSFRFTNDLITTFKQKTLMSHYTSQFLFNRTFNGFCSGVTAKVNSSCELIDLTVDEAAKAAFYEVSAPGNTADSAKSTAAPADEIAAKAIGGSSSSISKRQIVDSKKLAKAIEMAIWDATRKVKAAKEEYYHLSVKNARLLVASKELVGEAPEATEAELATIRDFSQYGLSSDSALLAPNPWNSLRDRSPFHTMLNSPTYTSDSTSPSAKEFAPTKPITLGDIIPEYRAAFLSYPSNFSATIADTAAGKQTASAAEGSEPRQPFHATATAEEKKASAAAALEADMRLAVEEARNVKAAASSELASDELAFWTRVEGIRKGQQAVIGASLNKRPYKDQAGAIPVSDFDEKVSLRFLN